MSFRTLCAPELCPLRALNEVVTLMIGPQTFSKRDKLSIDICRSFIPQTSSITFIHVHDRRNIIAKYIGNLNISLYTASPRYVTLAV